MPSSQPASQISVDGALAFHNYAIERKPQDDAAWLARAEHHESRSELKSAIAAYGRALAIKPDRLAARADFWRGVS